MSTVFQIEKTIAPPSTNRGRGWKYPFGEMEVGDSFLADQSQNWSSIRQAANMWGKRHGVRFTTARVDGGIRVWRVE